MWITCKSFRPAKALSWNGSGEMKKQHHSFVIEVYYRFLEKIERAVANLQTPRWKLMQILEKLKTRF